MKCLIIGDARFFGSLVAEELLAYNCQVAILDQNPLPEKIKARFTGFLRA
jgi:nucleoside-diphosphate-sugar epimerase